MVANKRKWIIVAIVGTILIVIIAFILSLNQSPPETIIQKFLTTLCEVEDTEKYEQILSEKTFSGKEVDTNNPLMPYFEKKYSGFCTKNGYEQLLGNNFAGRYEQIALKNNWLFHVKSIELEQTLVNQFNYKMNLQVTNLENGQTKDVDQTGMIKVKRELLGYRIDALKIDNSILFNPHPNLWA